MWLAVTVSCIVYEDTSACPVSLYVMVVFVGSYEANK